MTYLPTMGATDTAAPSFNTTKYPGVCKPTNQATLDLVFELQRQLNRVAQMRGLTKVAVDGDIGPGTVKLFNAVLGSGGTCASIASQIVLFTAQIAAIAASIGAPTTVSSPTPSKPPTFIAPTGLEVVAPKGVTASLSDSLGLPATTIAMLAVGAVGVGYYVTKKKGRK